MAAELTVHWPNVEQIAQQKNQSPNASEKLSDKLMWRRLVHYQCTAFSCESEQDGKSFFLSPEGKSNPEAELFATIQALRDKPELRCQFPARLTWLAKMTGNWSADNLLLGCDKYQEFKKNLSAKKVSLVFSSFYLNNPSSSFGHTLFKISKSETADNNMQSDLLSRGISYAANPTTSNPVLYAVLGLIGGFSGSYTNLPYYYKVREYNDFESRDIWEYELDLSADEIDMMVKHVWELGYSDFKYLYLSENCAYHLMNILDVAAERLNLSEPLPYWVLPLDTVKAVANTPGLVKKINLRVSLARSLESRFYELTEEEKKYFLKIIGTYQLGDYKNPRVLDAVIDHFDTKHNEQLLEQNKNLSLIKHKLLTARSQMPERPTAIKTTGLYPPHESHNSMRYELGVGQRERSAHSDATTTYVGVRFSLHDLLDPIWGLPPYARLEMFYGDFYYDNTDNRLHTNRLRFVGIEALNSWSTLWARPAWRFDLGAERIQDTRCMNCLTSVTGGSIGLAKDISIISPFVFLNARLRSGNFKNENISPEVSPSVGLRLLTKNDMNFIGEYERRVVWDSSRDTYDVWQLAAQKTFKRKWAIKYQFNYSDEWDSSRISFLLFQ